MEAEIGRNVVWQGEASVGRREWGGFGLGLSVYRLWFRGGGRGGKVGA